MFGVFSHVFFPMLNLSIFVFTVENKYLNIYVDLAFLGHQNTSMINIVNFRRVFLLLITLHVL